MHTGDAIICQSPFYISENFTCIFTLSDWFPLFTHGKWYIYFQDLSILVCNVTNGYILCISHCLKHLCIYALIFILVLHIYSNVLIFFAEDFFFTATLHSYYKLLASRRKLICEVTYILQLKKEVRPPTFCNYNRKVLKWVTLQNCLVCSADWETVHSHSFNWHFTQGQRKMYFNI